MWLQKTDREVQIVLASPEEILQHDSCQVEQYALTSPLGGLQTGEEVV